MTDTTKDTIKVGQIIPAWLACTDSFHDRFIYVPVITDEIATKLDDEYYEDSGDSVTMHRHTPVRVIGRTDSGKLVVTARGR